MRIPVLIAVALISFGNLNGSIIEVSDSSNLNDSAAWTTFSFASNTLESSNGITISTPSVFCVGSDTADLYLVEGNCGSSFYAFNFSPDDQTYPFAVDAGFASQVVAVGESELPGTNLYGVQFSFSSPVSGFGVQVNTVAPGVFACACAGWYRNAGDAQPLIAAYGLSGNFLGEFSPQVEYGAANAPFVGILDSSAEISSVFIATGSDTAVGDVYLADASEPSTSTPEPCSVWLALGSAALCFRPVRKRGTILLK